MTKSKQKVEKPVSVVSDVRAAGNEHQVVTVRSLDGKHRYRRKPCAGCPWIKKNAGSFPSEAFVHSAGTAYDMAEKQFGCHESGAKKPATCAGFLLVGAEHNLQTRLLKMKTDGAYAADVSSGDEVLFKSYREMAIANGVPADDAALAECRD